MTTVALAPLPDTVRRLTAVLFAGQSFASLGMTLAFTVSAIATEHLTGSALLAGVPTTLYLLGIALGAYPFGRIMDAYGRRAGLTLGFLLGLAGMAFASIALIGFVPILLFVAYALNGLSRGAIDQGRFAAADLVTSEYRARQVGWVVLGGTVGGIGGPLFIGPASDLAAQLGLDSLAGPFVAAVGLFLIGTILTFTLLRPDPHDIARRLAHESGVRHAELPPARNFLQVLDAPPAQMALAAMILAQVVMMTVMVMTPLQMTEHLHHTLKDVAFVIAAHITGMYGTSIVTGRIADRFGHARSILFGALLLILACVLAPFAVEQWRLAVALFILGSGWNFCFVAGSSLLTDMLRANERGRIQGTNDLIVGLVTATGSLGSGFAFATIGYGGMAAIGILLALALLIVVMVMTRGRTKLAVALTSK